MIWSHRVRKCSLRFFQLTSTDFAQTTLVDKAAQVREHGLVVTMPHVAPKPKDARFHFLVPATSTNKNLCRLLLSSAVARFPPPVFINWGAPEYEDPGKTRLEKIKGFADYLDRISTDENQDELVMILDGFDVWLQLPPEIFIQRYYSIIDAANERLAARMGRGMMKKKGIYQSIVFGPDKICWPENPVRAACWAVPDSTLPRWAFGPETDSGKFRQHNRPRWLNSGTILGPIGDLRKLFKATLALIASSHTVDSDQFYYAEIWGVQEYARSKAAGDLSNDYNPTLWISDGYDGEGHLESVFLEQPVIAPDQEPEYHITIDYQSEIFQTVAYYVDWLSWRHFSKSTTHKGNMSSVGEISSDVSKGILPNDVSSAGPPFTQASQKPERVETAAPNELPLDISWTHLPLGVNTVTDQIWGLIHFTPPKFWLDLWWFRMWYAPYAEQAIRNAIENDNPSLSSPYTETGDGKTWYPYVPETAIGLQAGGAIGGGFGADTGESLGWDAMCGMFQDGVFNNAPG